MESTPQTPLRCLHYHHEIRLEAGGVVRAVIDMLDRLADSGAKPTLITHNAEDCPAAWRSEDKVNVVTTPGPKAAGMVVPAEMRDTVKKLVAENDVLHLHTPWAVGHRVFADAAVAANKPYLLTLHGMLDDWCMTQSALKKRVYLKLIGRRLLEQAAFVHCTATGERDQSHKWYPAGTPFVLPYVIDLSPYDKQPTPDEALGHFPHFKQDGIKLLFLSRIHVKKGLERLIRACGILNRKGIAFQLGIAGPGEDDYVQQMKDLVTAEGIDERTHFLGMVRGSMKLSLYAASDLFVLPTSQENFGLVFPESMLCGTPVVGTRGTDIWRELEEGGGVICDMNPASVAEAIEPLAGMTPGEITALGQRGRDYVQKWLDPEQIASGYIQAYREAIAESSAS